jgi:regulator of extracellular matrix RemA (YlzA/DUF370 family)
LILLNIGFGNLVSSSRIISILTPDSAPMKRLVRLAKEKNCLIDASCGRKTQSIIIMDSGHVVLSALSSETLLNKFTKQED